MFGTSPSHAYQALGDHELTPNSGSRAAAVPLLGSLRREVEEAEEEEAEPEGRPLLQRGDAGLESARSTIDQPAQEAAAEPVASAAALAASVTEAETQKRQRQTPEVLLSEEPALEAPEIPAIAQDMREEEEEELPRKGVIDEGTQEHAGPSVELPRESVVALPAAQEPQGNATVEQQHATPAAEQPLASEQSTSQQHVASREGTSEEKAALPEGEQQLAAACDGTGEQGVAEQDGGSAEKELAEEKLRAEERCDLEDISLEDASAQQEQSNAPFAQTITGPEEGQASLSSTAATALPAPALQKGPESSGHGADSLAAAIAMEAAMSPSAVAAEADHLEEGAEEAAESVTPSFSLDMLHSISSQDLALVLERQSPSNLSDAIQEVVKRRPEMSAKLLADISHVREHEECSRIGFRADSMRREATKRIHEAAETQNEAPIVEFAIELVICGEGEETVTVKLVRSGNLRKQSQVWFKTVDGSATAGQRYLARSDVVKFAPGQAWQEVQIALLNNEAWDSNLEFSIELLRDGMQNAMLATGLRRCRVQILDDDAFPSNKFAKQIYAAINSKTYHLKDVNKKQLVLEYVKMNYAHPVVKQGTQKWLIADEVENMIIILQVFLQLIIIDYILNSENGLDLAGGKYKPELLMVLVLATVLPNMLRHFLDYRRCFWKVGGASSRILRSNLFRRYLGASMEARRFARAGLMIEAMTSQTDEVVQGVYINCLKCAANLGQLILYLLYQSTVPHIVGNRRQGIYAILLALVYPVVMWIYVVTQLDKVAPVMEEEEWVRAEFLQELHEGVMNFHFITDLQLNEKFIQRFDSKVTDLNAAMVNSSVSLNKLHYLINWLTWILVGTYFFLGGLALIASPNPSDAVATFITNLQILKDTGRNWMQVWENVMHLMAAEPALEQICILMNLAQDAHIVREVQEHRLQATQQLEQSMPEPQTSLSTNHLDLVPFQLPRSLRFLLAEPGSLPGGRGFIELQQGGFYAIVGPPGAGKKRYLTRLGGVASSVSEYRSTDEKPMVPCHLRVAHVVPEIFFMRGTLLENLTVGTHSEADAHPNRVRAICERLRVRPKTIALLSDERRDEIVDDFASFHADWWLLQIARVLVMNPEVICVHAPTMPVDDEHAIVILKALKDFVLERGLFITDVPMAMRRPRTCFFTLSRRSGVIFADKVFLADGEVISEVEDPSSVTPGMFVQKSPMGPGLVTVAEEH